jgi:hypothetical protein
MITQQQIHYFKSGIRQFKEAPRVKVNMDIVNREGKLNKFTWRMTQERREIYNSLESADDEGWPVYDEYVDTWKQIRQQYGQGVKLWIGKLSHRTRWSRGAQPLERVPFAVSLLALNRETQELKHTFTIDGWSETYEFSSILGADYNNVYTWQNPLSTVEGRRTRSLF